jgi:hypothetical protein
VRIVVLLSLCALLPPALAAEDVPEHYKGTWALDINASAANLSNWDGPQADKDRFTRELQGLQQANLTVTSDELIFEQGGRSDPEKIRVASLTADEVVLEDLAGRGRFNFRLLPDGLLIMESSGAPPMVFSRSASVPEAATDTDTSAVVAYLEALAACAPGDYPTALPGAGDIQNSIEGRNGEACRVRTGRVGAIFTCDYSPETIALLTSAQKLAEARNGVFSGSSDSEESRRVTEECRAQ